MVARWIGHVGQREAATLIRLAAADKDSRALQRDTQINLWVVDGSAEQPYRGPASQRRQPCRRRRRRSCDSARYASTSGPRTGDGLRANAINQRRKLTEATGNTTENTAENLRKLMAASTCHFFHPFVGRKPVWQVGLTVLAGAKNAQISDGKFGKIAGSGGGILGRGPRASGSPSRWR